jgi:hypothetical protein
MPYRLDDRICRLSQPNALVQLQAHYHDCGEAASEKCLLAATFVSWQREDRDEGHCTSGDGEPTAVHELKYYRPSAWGSVGLVDKLSGKSHVADDLRFRSE